MALRIDPRHQVKEAKEACQLISLSFALIAAEIFFKTAGKSICQMRRQSSFHLEDCHVQVENPLENRLLIASCVTLTGTVFVKVLRCLTARQMQEGRHYTGQYRMITWMMLVSASIMRDYLLD